ncbi:MAG: hypothetical protein ACRDQU_14900, partial [Pseudonocardiaceae bacterium]
HDNDIECSAFSFGFRPSTRRAIHGTTKQCASIMVQASNLVALHLGLSLQRQHNLPVVQSP